MSERKKQLATGEIYHIFNRSIEKLKIFSNTREYSRIIKAIRFYQREKPPVKLSRFISPIYQKNHPDKVSLLLSKNKLVEIIAYCIMPTHFHLILKQIIENGISIFMSNVLDSYTRYFNTIHKRKGTLWEGRFKNSPITSDEQLLSLTRYVHLNPATSFLVNKPEKWKYSSYTEYSLTISENDRICKFDDVLDINPKTYKIFVEDRISYQRDLAKIKKLLLEEPHE